MASVSSNTEIFDEAIFRRYTLGQFMALNHGDHLESGDLHKQFESYPPPRYDFGSADSYNNPYNHRFSQTKKSTKYHVKKAPALSDDSILEDIRGIFCGVTADGRKTQLTIHKMSQINIPGTKVDEISKLFQEEIIECGTELIDQLIHVIFTFRASATSKGLERKIQKSFVDHVCDEFKCPSSFQDTRIEEGTDKAKRWREMNTMIIAKLATLSKAPAPLKKLFSVSNVYERVVNPIVQGLIVDRNYNDADLLLKIWPVLKNWKEFREDPLYRTILDKLETFTDSGECNKLVTVKLMDIIDDEE